MVGIPFLGGCMMARRIAPWVATVGLIVFASCGQGQPPAGRDPRTGIMLPVDARDGVMAEMRTMLGSVNALLIAQAKRDTAAMRQAALASGTAAAADPALEQLLPEAWLKLAMSTHGQFDELAQAVSRPGGRDSVTVRLAALTGNCVACHATYRLEVRQ
ncbi:MAG: cytochrome c [Gemmatimonadetes bacterium]|nr:cytochrome c [Gemmatimonadota bacterium]